MTKEITIKENYNISKIKDMTAMSNILKTYVVKNKLYTNIKGKNYAHVEGWQFAGGMMGLFPKVVKVENLSSGNEIKWKAEVEIINAKTGQVATSGFALCSSKEGNKKNFDEYAILSMAQTRAIGKAYRNLVGWVMKLAGYEATPSEEMHKVGQEPVSQEVKEPVVGEQKGISCQYPKCQNKIISAAAVEYSKKRFNKVICKEHQDKIMNNV